MTDTKSKKYSLIVPTSMGVRLTPVDSQPFHCSDTFKMQATSAESNVASVASYLGDAALLEILLDQKPDIVGFTVYCWNLARSIYFAKKIKENYSPRIIFGGPEITPDNLDSFHFHGDPAQFPVDAVIVVPQDRKAGILLRGRYQKETDVQMLVPLTVIQDLLDTVFVVRDYVVLAGAGVAGAAFMIMALVFALSIRLRRREIQTIRKIGGSRQRLNAILCMEIAIVVGAGIGLAALLTSLVSCYGNLLLHIVEM